MNRSTLARRFANKCGPKNENGCIEWRGSYLNSGYGRVRRGAADEGSLLAHRAAWILSHGEIPNEMLVLHNCDNKKCVNAEHLRLGTQKENMSDFNTRDKRSWTKTSRTHHWERLPSSEIPKVFSLRAEGWTQQRIADLFGTSRELISLILNRKLKRVDRLANLGECHF